MQYHIYYISKHDQLQQIQYLETDILPIDIEIIEGWYKGNRMTNTHYNIAA